MQETFINRKAAKPVLSAFLPMTAVFLWGSNTVGILWWHLPRKKTILVSSPGALVKFPSCFSHRSWAVLSSTAELHSLIENLLFFPTEPGLTFHGIVEQCLQKASIHAFRTGSLKQHCSLSSYLPLSSVTLQGGAHYLVKGLLFPNRVRRSSSAPWVTKKFVL